MNMNEIQRAGRCDPLSQQRGGEPPHRHVQGGADQPPGVRQARHRRSACRCGRSASSRARAGPGTRTVGGKRTTGRHQQGRRESSRAARSGPASTCPRRRSTRSRWPTTAGSPCSARPASTWSRSDIQLNAVPRLAESWTPNGDASVWTFKIRQGVKFHDGKPMDAEDVVATINRLADPEERLPGPVGVHRRDQQGRRQGHRPEDGRVHARGAERQLPLPAQLGQLQHDHPARRTTTGTTRRT